MTEDQNRFNMKKTIIARSIPLAALILMTIGAIIGFLGGEIILASRSHPIHWVAAGITALLGFMTGMLIAERFGDIF